jgi:hypothetical protein
VESDGGRPPSTQEIPVVQPAGATATQQLPPHPGATTPAPVEPVEAHVPTGPVDFVPGLPGLGTPPPPPPVRPAPSAGAPSGTPETAPAATTSEQAPAATWPETLETGTAGSHRPRTARIRAPRNRTMLLGVGLTMLSVVLLELGLTMRWDDLESYWQSIPLWSAFATLCALLGLVAFVAFAAPGDRVRSGPVWRVAAAGLVGLAVFWLLVVLPVVATDRGFVLTAALAALGGALWVGPRQKD